MSQFYNDSIFWIEVDKIKPNPYQPRREFDQLQLKSLSDSIRQYGVLQALVVTRKEITTDAGLVVEYELIAGERRLRASRLAGLTQVPCLIKTGEEDAQMKLELAIIENLQREDLNAVDRAKAFKQLADEFTLTHQKIADKVGKSREYVSNTIRLLLLPEEMQQAIVDGKITEGHSRPLLMLSDRPEEQNTLFKEIIYRKLTVRETEQISRKVAQDKVRKKELIIDPTLHDFENRLSESFGTRVHIERKPTGGKILIDFFTDEDLQAIIEMVKNTQKRDPHEMMNRYIEEHKNDVVVKPTVADAVVDTLEKKEAVPVAEVKTTVPEAPILASASVVENIPAAVVTPVTSPEPIVAPQTTTVTPEIKKEEKKPEEDTFSLDSFSL